MHRLLNAVLAVALFVSAVLVWTLEPDPTTPNVQFIPEMHYSVPYNPQSANPVTADGKTLQVPPYGTVARGMLPLRFEDDDAGRARAGRELVNPVDPDSIQAFERGSFVYAAYCSPCHGTRGEGDGIVPQHGFPPPPTFGAPNMLALRDGEIFHTISFGKGNMPSLASQVRPEDRWNVILKVRSLQDNLRRNSLASAEQRGTP